MSRRNARQLAARVRRTKTSLRNEAEAAVSAKNGYKALPLLLELDGRFEPDAWVMESLADSHRWLRLPDPGLDYVRRHGELTGESTLAETQLALEEEHERWFRNQARLANLREERTDALNHALAAASVSEPSTWTLRVLAEVAVAAGTPELAVPAVARMRSHRPHDDALEQLELKLELELHV